MRLIPIVFVVVFVGISSLLAGSLLAANFHEIPEDDSVPSTTVTTTTINPDTAGTTGATENPPGSRVIGGVVRVIRGSPVTEVFFKDGKDSVIIPSGPQHNAILDACVQSSQTGKPINIVMDSVSHRALSVSNQNTSVQAQPAPSPVSNSSPNPASK